jgi:hypothetical protein
MQADIAALKVDVAAIKAKVGPEQDGSSEGHRSHA